VGGLWKMGLSRVGSEMSGYTGHCPIRGLCECFLNWGWSSSNVGHCSAGPDNIRLEVSILDGWKELIWLFSLHPHAPLNSTIFLYSRNMKNNFFNLSLHQIDYCHFSSFWLHKYCQFDLALALTLRRCNLEYSTRMINFHFWYPCHFISWFNKDWHLVIYDSS
jgi:hypothetical protein